MKIAGSSPEPAPIQDAPADAPDDSSLDFGGGDAEASSDKPFNDEPFDAGIETDEASDPKKFIEQLTGKLGQSLRKYNEEQGQPDFELEKFAINSLLSATHTSEMDQNDQDDIINKVKSAGNDGDKEGSNDDNSNDDNTDNGDDSSDNNSSNDSDNPSMDSGDSADSEDFGDVNEEKEASIFLEKPKKNNMFQPGSNDVLKENENISESNLKESKKNRIFVKLRETFNQDDMETSIEPMVEPQVAPVTKPAPSKAPSRKNKPFLPMPEVTPNPKAIKEAIRKVEQVYFNTYSGAVQSAAEAAEARGYTVNPDSWATEISFGSGKPKPGQTRSHIIELLKDGKPQKKALSIQVYNRGIDIGNTYELNFYIN